MNVTVFGGSNPKPGSTAYDQAEILGRLLARAGHSVLTGGYIGTMEAVSKGANQAGGYVIGVTCTAIETWRAGSVNAWVHEERHFETLQERLNELVVSCDAAIALPGGPGTLTEIAMSWNLMIVNAMPRKPLILVGNEWYSVMDSFFSSMNSYVAENQRNLLSFASDIHTAVRALDELKLMEELN